MISRLKLWYPFLFAPLPLLNTFTRNPGGSRLDDAAVVVAAVLLACAAGYLVIAATLRGRVPRPLVPLILLVSILLFYGKSTIGSWTRQVNGVPSAVLLAALLLLLGLVIWWVARRPRILDQVNTFFSLTGLLMVGWLGGRLAADLMRGRSALRNSALVRELTQPLSPNPGTAGRGASSRDIYLIVLDEYANSEILKEQFQYDNRRFEDSLRQLGFTIPAVVRSNYVHTLLSLPSLLNFSHLVRVAGEVGTGSTDATVPNYLVENNRTAAFLKQRGYRFVFFPSQWWPSTRHNRNADWEFNAWSGFNIAREASRSDLRRSLVRTTALAFVTRDDAWDADYIRRTLAALEKLPERAEPTFAFAHIVSPHWPYVFKADCRTSQRTQFSGRAGRQRAYAEQLQCLNRLVLHTVSTILQRSAVPPVILLQSDHGTNLLRYSDAKSAKAVTPAQARERFGAFGAYYLPGGGRRLFGDTVTVVNVLQKVLSHYHGIAVPPEPDDLYLSLERTPYDFAKVDPATLGN